MFKKNRDYYDRHRNDPVSYGHYGSGYSGSSDTSSVKCLTNADDVRKIAREAAYPSNDYRVESNYSISNPEFEVYFKEPWAGDNFFNIVRRKGYSTSNLKVYTL